MMDLGGIVVYFVNRNDIEKRISLIDQYLQFAMQQQTFTTKMEKIALERIVHVIIEAIIDVGNMMIDGFIMRDPGSYHDIIDILIDEEVLPKEDEKAYKALIDLRQMVVREYLQVEHAALANVLFSYMDTFRQFSAHIRTYLDNELGVANAFAKD